MPKPPRIVLSFPCSACAKPVRFQEVSGLGPKGEDIARARPVQQHHLEKLTPGCAYPACPLRWRDVRR